MDASESPPRPVISIEMDQETCGGKTHGKWDGVLGEVDGIEVDWCPCIWLSGNLV